MTRRVVPKLVSCAVVMALSLGSFAGLRADDDSVDMPRLRAVRARVLKGETLTPEDQTFYDSTQQALKKQLGLTLFPAPVPPPRTSTGLVPLTELGTAQYKGQDGGLYGGGSNEPPAPFRAAVEKQLAQIQPLDAQGRPAPDGKIAFISIGMSNTTMEFSTFKKKADADSQKSKNVVIVDCAQGARVASLWGNNGEGAPVPNANPWPVVDQRLKDAGVSPKQVQVAWIKHAQNTPHTFSDMPRMVHAHTLAANIILTLQRLHQRFPNMRVAYLSSRIYAGYATTPLNPEPYAYEGAFGCRLVIQAQAKGDPLLNFDPDKGTVMTPAVLWGPYLWGDGVKPRQADQLVWLRADLTDNDGTHPSESGREKVANLLLDFMHNNPLASCWYVRK